MKTFLTESDAGSVKVGILGKFTTHIFNGYGDGETTVIVLDAGEKVPDGARYETSVEGDEINIYAYDCCNDSNAEIVTTLSGRYCCYSKDGWDSGTVIFEKIEN